MRNYTTTRKTVTQEQREAILSRVKNSMIASSNQFQALHYIAKEILTGGTPDKSDYNARTLKALERKNFIIVNDDNSIEIKID